MTAVATSKDVKTASIVFTRSMLAGRVRRSGAGVVGGGP